MRTSNQAGFIFEWLEGSRFIEVYHADATFPDLPLEIVDMQGEQRSRANLKKFADEQEYFEL